MTYLPNGHTVLAFPVYFGIDSNISETSEDPPYLLFVCLDCKLPGGRDYTVLSLLLVLKQ